MMFAPRLTVDLGKIQHNAATLVDRLGKRGIFVTAVTKAALGSPEIVRAMLRGGVAELGDSRIENIEAMRNADIAAPMTLIRSPMLSQVDRVVASADVSLNSELGVIRRLSAVAKRAGRKHGVILMVELGDRREGLMPADVKAAVREILSLPNIDLKGLGTNLACLSGVSPDDANMGKLSVLVDEVERAFSIHLETVSGGNSANLIWAFKSENTGRINNLRLGESILLGREALNRQVVEGLHTDAITLVAEVIESKVKPTKPDGALAQTALGTYAAAKDRGNVSQSLLAIGVQDIDPAAMMPPAGTEIIGCSSDHLVLTSSIGNLDVGAEVTFQLGYSALLRAMTSPFVTKEFRPASVVAGLRKSA